MTEEQSFEATLDNELTYLVTVNTARDEAGTVFGRVVIMRDITYLKQLDQFKIADDAVWPRTICARRWAWPLVIWMCCWKICSR